MLVEEKAALMQKLGSKQLILQLQTPLKAILPHFQQTGLSLAADGHELVYSL